MPAPLDALHAALAGAPEVLILPHTNPDPDAIASAVALRALLVHQGNLAVRVGYRGIIGRAENRALVRYLGHPLRRVRLRDIQEAAAVVLVDTQPGAGNCPAQPTAAVRAVIDHHPARGPSPRGAFVDLRPTTGATATIVTEYLQVTDFPLTRRLATALFYGIKSDTLGLIRDTSAADIAAYLYLQPQINPTALMAIEQAPVPVSYFRQLNAAIQAAHIYEDVVIVNLGRLTYPDLAAELADWLLRLEGMQWSLCLGEYERTVVFSLRTRQAQGGAGAVAQAAVGDGGSAGGHGMVAGGQVPVRGEQAALIIVRITERVLAELGKAAARAESLVG